MRQPRGEPSAIHPLSMACFMEGVSPSALPLTQGEAAVVAEGLEELRKRPAVEAYLVCLEHLFRERAEGC